MVSPVCRNFSHAVESVIGRHTNAGRWKRSALLTKADGVADENGIRKISRPITAHDLVFEINLVKLKDHLKDGKRLGL
jgi:hypothetical protein